MGLYYLVLLSYLHTKKNLIIMKIMKKKKKNLIKKKIMKKKKKNMNVNNFKEIYHYIIII